MCHYKAQYLKNMTKLVIFDLDGTLTQHKTKLDPTNREVLEKLAEKYTLVMAGAGNCNRIFEQLNRFPIDVIGNYGLQYAKYNKETGLLDIVRDEMLEIKKKFGDERRTDIEAISGEVDIEDLIPEENCVVTYTNIGYIKRQPVNTYKTQNRGG